jgi:hypothetical protein
LPCIIVAEFEALAARMALILVLITVMGIPPVFRPCVAGPRSLG